MRPVNVIAILALALATLVVVEPSARAQGPESLVKVPAARAAEPTANEDWPSVEARLLGKAVVEVGEPFEVEVVCRHSADFEVEASAQVEAALSLDQRWLVLAQRAVPDMPAPGEPSLRSGFAPDATLVSRVVYTVASLGLEAYDGESGLDWREERTLDGLGLDVAFGEERRFVPAGPLEVRVTSLLGPTDRGPRPLPGPLAVEGDEPASTNYIPWLGGGAALLLAASFVVVRRRRTRTPIAPPVPTRRERLLELRDALASGEAPLRDSVFTLAASVRASCAERGVVNVLSDTDGEWRARVDPALFARGELERIDRFLRLAENARFAPATPTRWAVTDLANEAVAIDDETERRSAAGERPSGSRTATQVGAAARGEVEP